MKIGLLETPPGLEVPTTAARRLGVGDVADPEIVASPMGLGRWPAEDERDADYPLSAVTAAVRPSREEREYRYWWNNAWWGNQGRHPHCVSYAWLHAIEDGPVTWPDRTPDADPTEDPANVYHRAQEIDEWSGAAYDGTSVRAGAKVLAERGLITEYRWAWDLDDLVAALLYVGPVVLGTWWTTGMFYPDDDGFVEPTGALAGGHAYVATGANTRERKIRFKNSWGRGWGQRGRFWMRFGAVSELLAASGEACVATEVVRQ